MSAKTQISAAVKLTSAERSREREKDVRGEKNRQYRKTEGEEKEKEASVLIPRRIPAKQTERVHVRLVRVVVNAVTCCYSRGLATGLNSPSYTPLRYVSAKIKGMLRKF